MLTADDGRIRPTSLNLTTWQNTFVVVKPRKFVDKRSTNKKADFPQTWLQNLFVSTTAQSNGRDSVVGIATRY
jgi:hypothetical protein